MQNESRPNLVIELGNICKSSGNSGGFGLTQNFIITLYIARPIIQLWSAGINARIIHSIECDYSGLTFSGNLVVDTIPFEAVNKEQWGPNKKQKVGVLNKINAALIYTSRWDSTAS